MPYRIGEHVTVRADARDPYVLQFQYYADVVRSTDRGYYITTGSAFEPDGTPTEFGPFAEGHLLPGWSHP